MKNKDLRQEIVFYKFGGAWSSVLKKGTILSSGVLDTKEINAIEYKLGFFNENNNYSDLELKLAKKLFTIFHKESKKKYNLYDKLSFIPDIAQIVKGKYIELFNAGSSHIRLSYIAAFLAFFLEHSQKHPNVSLVGATGLDTVDISFLPFWDAYTFDTNLSPLIFTGSNSFYKEPNSDIVQNIHDVIKLAVSKPPSGAYWVFAGNVFSASDFIKVSPFASREIDVLTNFWSPHLKSKVVDVAVREYSQIAMDRSRKISYISPAIQASTVEELFNAMRQVVTIDLGDLNEIEYEIYKIRNPNTKAIIIAGHGYGNVNNLMNYLCSQAALHKKIVILISRCIVGDIIEKWPTNLIQSSHKYLFSKGQRIINGHKLNKHIARALATRAVHEKLDQERTQNLFNKYIYNRHLSEEDTVVL